MDQRADSLQTTTAEDILESTHHTVSHDQVSDEEQPLLHKHDAPSTLQGKSPMIIIFTISCTTLVTSLLSGTVTVSVPQISDDLDLDPGIELWYVSKWP